MISPTHLAAFSSLSNVAIAEAVFAGFGTTLRMIFVMRPSTPSLPTIRRASWSPHASLIVLAPISTISPFGRTVSRPITKSRVAPYIAARWPDAFAITMPPIVQECELPGSGGKKNPSLPITLFRSSQITPGSTTT